MNKIQKSKVNILLKKMRQKLWLTSCLPPALEFLTTAEVANLFEFLYFVIANNF